MEQTLLWLVTLCVLCTSAAAEAETGDSEIHAGHLQPFGSSGPFHSVDVMDNFPSTAEFFHYYVLPLRPLKMTGAAQLSSAFHKWTDEYFLQTAISVNSSVAVEMNKKENRNSPLQRLHFHEFLRLYNSTDQYMVDNIPQEFRFCSFPDVYLISVCITFAPYLAFCCARHITNCVCSYYLI